MIEIRKNDVIIPLTIWNELKKDAYLREIIEILDDSKDLKNAKKQTTSFIDFKSYDKKRRAKMKNV